MIANIKIFLFCPIPYEQKPLTRYLQTKKNFLSNSNFFQNQTQATNGDYWAIGQVTIFRLLFVIAMFLILAIPFFFFSLKKIYFFFESFAIFYQPLDIFANLLGKYTVFLFLGFGFLFIFFSLLIFFRWQEIKKLFLKTRFFYEESSWFNIYCWEKPLLVMKNDRLLATQKLPTIGI